MAVTYTLLASPANYNLIGAGSYSQMGIDVQPGVLSVSTGPAAFVTTVSPTAPTKLVIEVTF